MAIAPKLVNEAEQHWVTWGFFSHDLMWKSSILVNLAKRRSPLTHWVDQIEFLFAPNPGEPFKPLKSIASSGEMARVMLALKTVLASQDSIPILIFDEVDANIGGETVVVGQKMKQW